MRRSLLTIIFWSLTSLVIAKPITIVAAENFYGQVATEIGGDKVVVKSIINNPNSDPHLFATSVTTSKNILSANLIIYNGMNYDAWMDQFLQNVKSKEIICVADLVKNSTNINPHIWYLPETFPLLAREIYNQLIKLDAKNKAYYNKNLAKFLLENKAVITQINLIKAKYAGTPVAATEPVFGYMVRALGLKMEAQELQYKIMNDSEPSPKMIIEFQKLIAQHKIKVIFFNQQVTSSLTNNFKELAVKNKIPLVGVTETLPTGLTANQWLLTDLKATRQALDTK